MAYSIAPGAQDSTLNATNGALFFIQVSAVAQDNAEIAVSENGIRQGLVTPVIGLIADGSQIPTHLQALQVDPIATSPAWKSPSRSPSVRLTATRFGRREPRPTLQYRRFRD
jgi:hypothetical protein